MRIRAGSQAKTGMAEEKETKGIDYQTWEFTGREYLEIAGISLGIAAAVNLLCYRAWWACIAVVPVGIVYFHTYRKNRIQRRKEELYDSFRDLIAWMHTALRSGYSMENAVLEAAGQLEQSLGKENILVQELRQNIYSIAAKGSFELIRVGRHNRATKESFMKWYQNQTRYQLAEDRQERR